jgi:hypothetical protein
MTLPTNRLCGLVIRVPGYRPRSPGFHSQCYQIFWEVVGLERGPLSLVHTIEELLGRNSSGSGLESQEYDHVDPLHQPRDTLYLQKLALTSVTNGGRSVGIVRSWTKAMELRVSFTLLPTFPQCSVLYCLPIWYQNWCNIQKWAFTFFINEIISVQPVNLFHLALWILEMNLILPIA